jgi:hypothetical protein
MHERAIEHKGPTRCGEDTVSEEVHICERPRGDGAASAATVNCGVPYSGKLVAANICGAGGSNHDGDTEEQKGGHTPSLFLW